MEGTGKGRRKVFKSRMIFNTSGYWSLGCFLGGTMVIYLYKMLFNWHEKVGKYTNADDIVATTGMDNIPGNHGILYENVRENK